MATIPVVMLTASLSPSDEQERERLHPTWCLLKPAAGGEFRNLGNVLAEAMREKTA